MNNIVRNIRRLSSRILKSQFQISRAIVFLLVAALMLGTARQTRGCGPFFTDAIFVYTKHPDFPLEQFARGQLGVLKPGYARSYLFVAYRNLIGVSFSEAEVSALKTLWDERLNYAGELDDSAWVKTWTDARSKVPGVGAPAEIRAFRHREKPHEYETFLNCQQDAFENAAATLAERIKRFGADGTQVRTWISGQDLVFANCSEGNHIPEPLSSGVEALSLNDRAYQIAAANFYAGNFDEATRSFDTIAHDRVSPWRESAPYLAARSLIRKASLAEKEDEGRPALADAETRLNAILRDKSLSSSHHAAARLANLVRLRLHPEEKLHELAHAIVKKENSDDFKQAVWDYTALLDKFVGDDEEANKKPVAPNVRSDELSDWLLTFQSESAEASTHSLERWEKTNSLPWLVVALAKADAHQPKLDALLSAAERIDHNSPAFPSIAYHTVRLLMESRRNRDALRMLDAILANDRSRLPASAINLFLGQRMLLAETLEEFLKSAQRAPTGFSDDSDGRELPEDEKETTETTRGSKLFFDADATNTLNTLAPIDVLTQAAFSKTLAINLRRDVARAAFMRAALLDDRESAGRAAVLLGELHPELKELLAAYQRAATPDARRFAAAYLSLKFPGMRPYVASGVGRTTPLGEIDSFRDNWWCAQPPASLSGPPNEEQDAKKVKKVAPPEFLLASQAVAAKQFSALRELGAGPDYFCRLVIEWARQNPTDPRVPEALHLAVRSTRYGCTDKETGRWSKAAFDLLHARYPNSSWAKQTKYWFKD